MYQRILVPLDGSPTARRGLEHAVRLAQACGAALHLVHVVDARRLLVELSDVVPPERLLHDWRAAGERLVASALRAAREQGVEAAGAVRCDPAGRVCDLIVREAKEQGAELIVMGTHGRRGLQRLALGSDAELVLRDSPVPVLLLRAAPGDVDA